MEEGLVSVSFLFNHAIITANTGLHSVSVLDWEHLDETGRFFGAPGFGPHGLTVCKSRQFLYCANSYDRTISAVDCLKGRFFRSASVGTTPCHLAYCRKSGCLYVTNFDSDSVGVVRERNMEQISSIQVGRMPHDILFSHQTGLLYAAIHGENGIAVLDPESNGAVDRISLRSAPLHLKVGETGKYLYIAGTIFEEKGFGKTRGEISIVDLERGTLAATLSAGTYLTDVCIDEEEGILFAADGGESCIHILEDWKVGREMKMEQEGEFIGKRRRVKLEPSAFPSCIAYVKAEGALLIGDHMSGKVTRYRKTDFQKLAESRCFPDMSHFLVL